MEKPRIQLRDYAYFKTGGTCDEFHQPATTEELSKIVKSINSKKTPYFLLGGGTNSLVSDFHFEGAVISFQRMNSLSQKNGLFHVGAGIENSQFAQFAFSEGYVGASWMNRLPGQMGGTIRMNARCYGGEISQIVKKVEAVMPDGEIRNFSDPSIFRGYKDTLFMENGAIIASCQILLAQGDLQEAKKLMDFCESDRVAKQQFEFPTCGCVFKNDRKVGVSSGMLLDAAGVKNFEHNGAVINPSHANFVFNKNADSRAILEMTFKMRDAVYEKFGVWLEYEMEFLGTLENDLKLIMNEKKPHKFKLDELEPMRQKFQKNLASS